MDLNAQTLLYENWSELDDDITFFSRVPLYLIWTYSIIDTFYTVIKLNWINE